MRRIVRVLAGLAGTALAGCGVNDFSLIPDGGAVNSPAYSANRVFFLEHGDADAADRRRSNLEHGYSLVREPVAISDGQAVEPVGPRNIRTGEPLSFVISKVRIPETLPSCVPRLSDVAFHKGRDIAFILDTKTGANKEVSLIVWFQTDVRPGDNLSFQDLLVYSDDNWDERFPPYFRLRLVDVSSLRNTQLHTMLGEFRSASDQITAGLGAEDSGLVGLAELAAELLLANEKSIPILDFTFQLYGEAMAQTAGGFPLGVLRSGGLMLTAPPCDATTRRSLGSDYYEDDFRYDFRLQQVIDDGGTVQDVPYALATVMTAEQTVPQIIRTRSASLTSLIADPQTVTQNSSLAQSQAQALANSLMMVGLRERFLSAPDKGSLQAMIDGVAGEWEDLAPPEQEFFLTTLRRITGVTASTAAGYQDWYTRCEGYLTFEDRRVSSSIAPQCRVASPTEIAAGADDPAAGDGSN